MRYENSAQKPTFVVAFACFVGCCFATGFLLLLLSVGAAVAQLTAPDVLPRSGEIVANPQAAYTFAGWDQLGRMMGLPDESGIRLGGFFINELNWVASGGVRPNDTTDTFALGFTHLLTQTRPSAFQAGHSALSSWKDGGSSPDAAAGSVQQLTTMDGPLPHSRRQLNQLWWHQRLFDDRLIFLIGKMNGSGVFGNVQVPVATSDPRLQDHDITNLLFVPVGLNPTLFGRLPSYPNTGYGAVVHYAPTKEFYASYGLFDANGIHGEQTGLYAGPEINTYKLHIGELGYSWRVGEEKKPGRIGVGGWYAERSGFYTPI